MLIYQVPEKRNQVAITFDDGPDPVFTPQVLDILREHDAKATFFMIGEQMDKYPDIAKAVFEAGHEIGNHTLTHPFLTKLAPEDIRKQLAETEERIVRITGSKPVTFRPPFFDFDDKVAAEVKAFGYHSIGCVNGAAEDWNQPGTEHILEKTVESLKDGCVFIFHDGYGDRTQTVEALRRLLPILKERGFTTVRADELTRS